jgi:Flp pilus assembly protein TadG
MKLKTPSGNNKSLSHLREKAHRLRGIFHSQSGQSLVELALLSPLLLVLVIGTIEMGRYASLALLVGNAARAGAAYGSQNTTKAADAPGIRTAALNDGQNISGLTVTSTFVCGCDTGGTVIPNPETNAACATTCAIGAHLVVFSQVTATGKFTSLLNYPGIPTPLTITSTATERIGE